MTLSHNPPVSGKHASLQRFAESRFLPRAIAAALAAALTAFAPHASAENDRLILQDSGVYENNSGSNKYFAQTGSTPAILVNAPGITVTFKAKIGNRFLGQSYALLFGENSEGSTIIVTSDAPPEQRDPQLTYGSDFWTFEQEPNYAAALVRKRGRLEVSGYSNQLTASAGSALLLLEGSSAVVSGEYNVFNDGYQEIVGDSPKGRNTHGAGVFDRSSLTVTGGYNRFLGFGTDHGLLVQNGSTASVEGRDNLFYGLVSAVKAEKGSSEGAAPSTVTIKGRTVIHGWDNGIEAQGGSVVELIDETPADGSSQQLETEIRASFNPGSFAVRSNGSTVNVRLGPAGGNIMGSNGLKAEGSGLASLRGKADIIASAKAVWASGSGSSATFSYEAGSSVRGALRADAGGRTDVAPSASGGDVQITGNLEAAGAGSVLRAVLTPGSSLTGKAATEGTAVSSVDMQNTSVWNVTGSSSVTDLRMNGSTVNLSYETTENDLGGFPGEPTEEIDNSHRTLTAQTLTGSGGLLRMRAVVTEGNEAADRLVVTGTASGSYRLDVEGSGEEPAVESMSEFLVQAQRYAANGSTAAFALAGGSVDIGNYVYELAERDSTTDAGAKEWYLRRCVSQPDNPETPDEPLSPSAETVLAFNGANTMAAFHWSGLDDLRKRLGEVRAQGDRRGAWASAGGSVSRTKNFPGLSTRIESFRLNAGADAKVSDTWLLGGSLRFTTGDEKTKTTFAGRSSADVHSEGLSLYAAKIWDSGAYLDLVASTDLFHQEVRGTMIGGRAFKGSFSAWGWGLSAEAGHQLRFGEKAQWFAEPSVQLSYYRAEGPSYTLSNGMKVDDESTDAITGRAGTLVGRRFYDETGAFDGDAYIRAGVIHQFGGGHSTVINGESFALRGLGSRWYAGVGGEIRVGRDAKIYGYAETQHGNRYSTEIEGRVGFKLLF